MESRKLTGKVVVVTGASSRIGEATALRLAQSGARLVLAARRADKLCELGARIRDLEAEALEVPTDVTNRRDMESLLKIAGEKFGRVDVLVNNAGIMPLSQMKNIRVEEWDKMIDVNLRGVLYGIAAALPVFRKQRSGHFINVASVGGRRLYAGAAVYCATKFAVRAVSEGLRLELDPADGVKVTVIEPGAVRTELPQSVQDPEQRERLSSFSKAITFLEAQDVAESIHYALSQADRVNVDEILLMPREQGH